MSACSIGLLVVQMLSQLATAWLSAGTPILRFFRRLLSKIAAIHFEVCRPCTCAVGRKGLGCRPRVT